MNDKHGNAITVGARVRKIDAAGMVRILTVRGFSRNGDAFADDGNPLDGNKDTNGWKLAGWLRAGDDVEVI